MQIQLIYKKPSKKSQAKMPIISIIPATVGMVGIGAKTASGRICSQH